ncbi:calcium calmodulin-dependent protein kinase [Niveomyces insectorum RCEF 264]|uniref:Calcium calmodulin-dependent protein kinase n=1 Tax=Niveomyces insectorum RCEF 264 TaxID=1081102 RepID=A0A167PH89_9HYPO|nr:calcium calmodulin-dependent protein kinase [Niveomyces insectorum RCEF 264]
MQPVSPVSPPPPTLGEAPFAAVDPAAGPSAASASPPADHGNNAGFLSAPVLPAYRSPLRQHRRTPSQHREVKTQETLDAVSEYAENEEDGLSHHKINQYTIKTMIGRGSYGAVHLATDQYGQEYAIKEFSKARLRKRARSIIMKKGPFRAGPFPGGGWPGGPLGPSARLDGQVQAEANDSLYLIREEIAIMKKLNHPNLVQLIEVLDDPEQDSLYMVLEMCKKGVVMDVDLGKTATPYDAETCRCWFRDLILGIEYLHAQNIIHRDIKPDNLLLTEDDVLKIGDFGVSEIFEKSEGMRTSKTAGSPAFLPPELCVSHHGDVSGAACDIWSMGVTLYCLRYGRIPFEHPSIFEIFEAINHAEVQLPDHEDEDFADLMHKLLEKDPNKRIIMAEIREHSWVTLSGKDPLLSVDENCANPIEPPNALELNHAFTRKMGNLLVVAKAISKFKGLLHTEDARLDAKGDAVMRFAAEPTPSATAPPKPSDAAVTTEEEVARLVEERRNNIRKASLHTEMMLKATAADVVNADVSAAANTGSTDAQKGEAKGGAAFRPTLLLGIGTGGRDDSGFDAEEEQESADGVVSESPTAADFDIYGHAFQSEIKRIRSHRNHRTVYRNNLLEREGRDTAAQEDQRRPGNTADVPNEQAPAGPTGLWTKDMSADLAASRTR